MNNSHCLCGLALGFTLCLTIPAHAFIQPAAGRLPDVERRFAPAANAPAPAASRVGAAAVAAEVAALRQQVPGVRVDFDPHFGTVASVRSTEAFLTPALTAGGPPLLAAAAATEPERVVRAFLDQRRALFDHGGAALDGMPIKQQFTGRNNGLRTAVWQQERGAIPVHQATVIAHVTARGELVSVSSGLLPDAVAATPAIPSLSASEAAARAAEEVGGKVDPIGTLIAVAPSGPAQSQRLTAPGLLGEATVQLLWLPMSRETLRLCWQVVFTPAPSGEMFLALVDAQTGETLVRRCLTEYATEASFRVFTSDSPTPLSPGYSTPVTNQPAAAARELITLTALNTNASPSGWIEDTVNETRGNNVEAHLDRDRNNIADMPRPQGSPARVFDPSLDLTQPPLGQGDAAVVQLFYTCNWMHDRLYELGFTEAAGNFQITNFARGGLGNDALQADAQDGSGTNNANMSTPPDGSPPRMQMFLFNGPTPDRDGDFDTEVVLHEYTHGLSNRRVGGGAGLYAAQSRGLGEGWSDFYALALLTEPGDDPDGIYASGAYVSYLLRAGFTQNYYFGIRRYPYCTDLGKNPLTFQDIDPTQASAHDGVPFSPLYSAPDANPADVHNQGEVWCAMLWEVRARLVHKHGLASGNELTLQLVTDALALTPANPTFIQARDAILQADLVNNAGTNRTDLWQAFAKRGLGWTATAPASSTTTGVVESYDVPDALGVEPHGPFVASGPVGGPFEPAGFTLSLTNVGSNALTWSLISTSAWLSASSVSGTLAPGGPAVAVTLAVSAVADALPTGLYSSTVLLSNHSSQVIQSRVLIVRVGQPDSLTELFSAADNDLDFQSFTFTPNGSPGFYYVCRETITSLPTPPADGRRVTLPADSIALLVLTNGAQVSLYGSNYTRLYLAAAGHLTFTQPLATNFTESLSGHFNRPRVSALYDDLDPTSRGAVYWQQLPDRAAVSFIGVPEYGLTTSNSFQIEMFFDGRIRLSYLGIAATDGLIGLSAGAGVPAGFLESDFSSYGACFPPLRLTLPSVAMEGAGILHGACVVQLPLAVASNVVVTLRSLAVTEVSVPGTLVIPAGQTNGRVELTILDDTLLDGAQPADVEASASGFATSTGRIIIRDNDSASLQVLLPSSVAEGAGSVSGTVIASAPPDAAIPVTLSSSDLTELQVPALVTLPAGQTSVVFTASVLDDTQIDGAQSVTVTARVENWTNGAATLTVTDNESRALVLTLPASVVEDSGVQTNAGQLSLAGTLDTNLVVSLDTANALRLTVPATLTVLAGQTSAHFHLLPVNGSTPEGDQIVAVTAVAAALESATNTIKVVDDDIAPILLTQPVGRTLYAGGSAAFSATAFGQRPLAWQWRLEGTNLPGQTSAQISMANVTTNQSGDYTVRVTNDLGSVVSDAARLTVLPIPPCLPPPANLVAWWRGESNTWDQAGYAHAAAAGSNPLPYTDGKVGTALYCRYGYYAVAAGVAPNLGTNAGLTVEGWIRPESWSSLGNPILEWSLGTSSPTGFGVALGLVTTNGGFALRANLRDSLGIAHLLVAQPQGITNGVWSHIALTYGKASGQARLFVNGALVADANVGTLNLRTQGRLLLGGGTSLTSVSPYLIPFNGAVDELSLYSRVLEPAEVQALVAASVSGKCAPVSACILPPTDLVAWWRAESNTLDSAGLNFARSDGKGNFGETLSVGYQPGVVGAAFSFPSHYNSSYNSSLLYVPADPDLDVGARDGMTLEGWFLVSEFANQPGNWFASASLASWNDESLNGIGSSLHILKYSTNLATPTFYFGGATFPSPILRGTNVTVPPGQWNHIAVTYDKVTGRAVMYLNGAVAGQTNVGTLRPWTIGHLMFGDRTSSSASGHTTGLDEISLFSRALTATEVRAIFRAGTAGKCPPPPQCEPPPDGLVAWWRGEDDTWDNAGLNHGVPVAASYAPGIVGRSFSSTSGWLAIPSSAELNVGAGPGLTIEGWVKARASFGALPIFAWGNTNGTRGLVLDYLPYSSLFLSAGHIELHFTDAAGSVRTVSTTNDTASSYVWQHLAATYDRASGVAALYVNGRQLARTNLGSFTPVTTDDLYLGFQPATGNRFSGELDELAVYNRALTAEEIRDVVLGREAGKCRIPPAVIGQPANLIATVSSNATLSVAATGNARLRYEWQHDGLPLPRATTAAFTITNVEPAHAGVYSVRVTNWFGSVVSSNAVLSLNYPPQAGLLPAATFTNTPITISLAKLLSTAFDPDGDSLTVSAVSPVSTQNGSVGLALLGATYQPALDFLGLDRFAYTVSDSRGGAATGTVEVGVRSRSGLSGNMLPAVTWLDGTVQVRFLGVPGRGYSVQRATSLPGVWTTLGTVQTVASGLGLLLDANPPAGQAFYRTVYP